MSGSKNTEPEVGSTEDINQAQQIAPESEKGKKPEKQTEIGGPKGLEPTRYGDWEAKGRCYDF